MYINHNGMASNVANNLTSHYSNLATSTQRLSSGLRVNSAADDAAGLAIRELMRADIASLQQGVRNANDAISMIQTADGALGIIDEKLIRMKELAEQAATGTYDSTQRMMIDSEYQAMASEITRIANATDFNGMKLLDGSLQGAHDGSKLDAEGSMKIHFGTGNNSAEDYYYVEIGDMTAQALGVGNGSTWQDVQNRGADALKKSLTDQIKNDKTLTDAQRGDLLAQVDKAVEQYNAALDNATDYKQAYKFWGAGDGEGFMAEGKEFPGNSSLMADYMAAAADRVPLEGGAISVDGIAQHFKKAVDDAFHDAGEVDWTQVATADDQAALKRSYWEKASENVKEAAKSAGFTDAETSKLLKQMKTDWDLAAAPTNDAGLTTLKDTLVKVTAAGAPDTSALKTFLDADAGLPGEGINGDIITLRNKGYQEYIADPDGVVVGPTDVNDIIGQLQDAVDEAWSQVDTTKNGTFGQAQTGDANAEFAKVLNAIESKAKELGFSDDEAAALKVSLNKTGTIDAAVTGLAANHTIATTDADAAAADWAKVKTGIKSALTALSGTGTAALVTEFKDTITDNPLTTAGKKESIGIAVAIRNQGRANAVPDDRLEQFWNGLRDSEKQQLQYAWGKAASYNLANAETDRVTEGFGIEAGEFKFNTALGVDATAGDVNMKDNNMLANALDAANKQVSKADFAGYSIETQENAQQALNALNDAITEKDKVRAHLGALQNRLENTVSNLTVQSENLQAAESRISDVDVATEMTNFVRNQILTQSAVAMLSQANSMPQMAMQLIG